MSHRNPACAATLLAFGLAVAGIAYAAPVGTAFTYQGRLDELGLPADGLYDFRVGLWTAEVGGVQLAAIPLQDVEVVDGLFTVDLDFGAIEYEEAALWLAISVGPDDAELEELLPRQRIRPAPVALGALGVAAGSVGADEVDPSEVQLRVVESCGPDASIASILDDGTVICEEDDEGAAPLWFPPAVPYVGPGLIHTGANLVGINTQNPQATLHVHDAGATLPAILVDGAGTSEGDIAFPTGESLEVGDFNTATGAFTTRLRIFDSGEVRIVYNQTFPETLGDKISLFGNRIGQANMFGLGIAASTLYYKANGAHSWFIGDADPTTAAPSMRLVEGGLGIGTTNIPAAYRLVVNGAVRAKEIVVETGWADDVFAPGYPLRPLPEVEAHIRSHGRLPGVPSAEEVETEGVAVGEMTSLLLRKVEELTLYVLELERRVDDLGGGGERPADAVDGEVAR